MPTRDPIDKKPQPTAKEVNEFHEKSDKDGGPKALHHTLGPLPGQASPGDHSHDGGSSQVLLLENIPKALDGFVIDGTLPANPNVRAPLKKIIEALVLLGAKDETT